MEQLNCATSVSAKNICENTTTVEYYCNVQSENLAWIITRTIGRNRILETILLGKDIIPKVHVFNTGTAQLISAGTANGRSTVPGAVSKLIINITVATADSKGDIMVSCQDSADNHIEICSNFDLTSSKYILYIK